ncbi:MAG: PAS domain S-box protein [Thermodesulfobacteriota bacterium]
MQDQRKTKAQLLEELAELRARLARLEGDQPPPNEPDDLYRNIVRTANEGIWVLDADYRTTFVNQKLAAMLGYRPQDMLGRPGAEFVHPEDLAHRQEQVEQRRRGLAGEYERRWLHKDGSVVWVWVRATPLFDDQGQFSGVFSMATDITQRKRAQEALRKNEALLRAILDGITTNLAFVNRDMEIKWANKASALSVGLTPEQMVGRKCHELWADPAHPCAGCPSVQAFSSGRTESTIITTPDGRVWDEKGEPVYDEQSELIGVLEIAHDITAQSKTHQALAQSRQLYALATQAGKVGVWQWDLDSNHLWVDPIIKTLLGYGEQEIPDTFAAWLELAHPDDREMIQTAAQMHIRGDTPFAEVEVRLKHKDGSLRWTLLRGEAQRDQEGRARKMLGAAVDITLRKQAEENLRLSEERYSEVFRASPLWVSVTTLEEGRYLDVNESFHQITGYSREEVLGRTSLEVGVWPYPLQRREAVEIIKREGSLRDFHIDYRTKSGELLHALWSARLLELEGRPCLTSVVRDITARVRAQQALQESEERFRALYQDFPHPTCIWEHDGADLVLRDGNPAAEKWTQGKLQKIVGAKAREFWADLPELHQAIHRCFDQRELVILSIPEYRSRATGAIRHIIFTFTFAPPRHVFEYTEDITDRERARLALQESERKYRSLFEGLNDAVFITDQKGNFLEVNQATCQRLGYSREEMLAMRVRDILAPEELSLLSQRLSQLSEKGALIFEGVHRTRQGRVVPVEVSLRLVQYQGQEAVLSVVRDISERQAAAQALKESEQRFRALFEWAPVAVVVLNHQYEVVRVNSEFTALFGYQPAEAEGRSIYELLVPPEEQPAAKTHGQLVARGQRPNFEGTRLRKDGSRVYTHISSRLVANEGREPVFYVTYQDISERRRSEEALQQSETRYRELFNNMSAGVAVYEAVDNGADFVFKEMNWAGERITQLPKEQVLGRRVSRVFPGVKDLGLFEVFQRVWRTGVPEHHPTSLYKDNRLSLWVENFVCQLPTGEVVAIFDDITLRKQAEDSLQWELEVNTALANLSHAMISNESDLDSIAGLVLHYAQRITGARHGFVGSLDSADGLKVARTLSNTMAGDCQVGGADQRPSFHANPDGSYPGLWGHSLNTRESFYTNSPAEHPSAAGLPPGHIPLKNFLSVPVMFAGRLVGQVCLANSPRGFTVRDLRALEHLAELLALAQHRRQAEQESQKLQAQLRQTQKLEAIGTLAGGIAHDFNNVLAAMLGYTELTLTGLPLTGEARDNLEQVLKAGQRARDLVHQILSFSRRSDQGQSPVEIMLLTKEALKLLRASLPTTIEIQSDLRSQGEKVLADPVQIQQVIMNLCTNAAQAMPGGGLLTVELVPLELDQEAVARFAGLRPGRYLRLTVSDTGVGMDARTLERIFEPFFTTKGPGEGTGLGLSVVHGVVQSHRGAITVYSEPGRGTTFHVYLPVMEGEPEQDGAQGDGALPRGQERVLLVDDEPALAEVGRLALETLGYRVTALSSSPEALERFQAQPEAFDLVITDYTMPQMTGAALAQELIKIRPDIPIIMCSGFSGQFSPQQAREMGIRRLLLKPLVSRELAVAVRRVLDEAQQDD